MPRGFSRHESDMRDLKAWCRQMRERPELLEHDELLLRAVENLISQVGTFKARAERAEEQAIALRSRVSIYEQALIKIRDYNTLDGEKYVSYVDGWHGVAKFAGRALDHGYHSALCDIDPETLTWRVSIGGFVAKGERPARICASCHSRVLAQKPEWKTTP